MDKPKYENMGKNFQWIKNLIFAGVFIQENKLHAVFDRYNEMTSKQWLLVAVCSSFDDPPDLTSLAGAMGCSRQNVKKLALSLEKNGYAVLQKSEADARTLCVSLTEKGICFRKNMSYLAEDVYNALFSEFTEEELMQYYKLSIKLMNGIDHLGTYFRKREGKNT